MSNKEKGNCFREFDDVNPRKKDPSIHVLFEYEKHYMELVREYSSEIKFIEDMLKAFRAEQTQFYEKTLPQISRSMTEDQSVDDEMKKVWLNRLSTNLDRSYLISEKLINDYATKSIDEFKKAVDEKLKSIE